VPQLRWSSREPLAITEVRKGMILCEKGGEYWEVKDWAPQKQGRGAASYNITYEDLETGKEKVHKYGASAKCYKLTPDRAECTVMYFTGEGKEEKKVVLADEEFNELEVPLSRFHSGKPEEGAKVVLYKDEEAIVKVTMMRQ